MFILDCEQGTEEWLEARRAIPTSSCFSRILTPSGALSNQWDGYMNKLLAEYLDPEQSVAERIYTKAMKRGNEMEPLARTLYEDITGDMVTEVGGLFFDEDRKSMCSPDGLIVHKEKGLEIKSPNLSTHIGYVRKGKMPDCYSIQVQSGMAFSGYSDWDFMSFHPSYKPLIITIKRDAKLTRKIKKSVEYFVKELDQEKKIIDEYNNLEF